MEEFSQRAELQDKEMDNRRKDHQKRAQGPAQTHCGESKCKERRE